MRATGERVEIKLNFRRDKSYSLRWYLCEILRRRCDRSSALSSRRRKIAIVEVIWRLIPIICPFYHLSWLSRELIITDIYIFCPFIYICAFPEISSIYKVCKKTAIHISLSLSLSLLLLYNLVFFLIAKVI